MRGVLFNSSAALALALTGCAKETRKAPDPLADDPAITSALADEIMVDPDLVGQNRGNTAITVGGPASAEVPPEQSGPDAAAAARADAVKQAGGAIRSAPEPTNGKDLAQLLRNAATGAQVGRAAKSGNVDCAGKVDYSAQWAARLPSPLEVYARGAVQEAAGTDSDGCSLRVVHFVTPVGARDVIDYYFTRVSAAGYDARHTSDGGDHVLGGRKGTATYLVYARGSDAGLTEVDLIVSGG